MRRFLRLFVALLLLIGILSFVAVSAQGRLVAGDPPVAALISVSQPDADGLVTISGAAGAVFPAAQVAIRNLYTGDSVYTQAGITGTFSAVLYGPGNTPFWISPAANIPQEIQDRPGSLPGGPGTIVYGEFAQTPTQSGLTTQLTIDGSFTDWERYAPTSVMTDFDPTIFAFTNTNSIYVALVGDNIPTDYTLMDVLFNIDGTPHSVLLDPRGSGSGVLSRGVPTLREVGTFALAASQDTAIEIRFPHEMFIYQQNPSIDQLQLQQIRFLNADGSELAVYPMQLDVPKVDESDGITHSGSPSGSSSTTFTLSGTVGGGSGRWQAVGHINTLALQPGDTLSLTFDVQMDAPDVPLGLVGLKMLGRLRLQPVLGADGAQVAGGLGSNNGWSDAKTASGLAISNLRSDFQIAEVITPANQVIRQDGLLLFPVDFNITLPADLPAGIYVPLLEGLGQVEDGDVFDWAASSPLGTGSLAVGTPYTRLPLTLTVGDVPDGHLLWTLFQDAPSDGSRGLLAAQDQAAYALANRVHFDNPTYILPKGRGDANTPIAYPLEPYLLNQLPNQYAFNDVPLIPFLMPGGRLSVKVTRPDGQVDDLGSSPIVQNILSTAALDERVRFGEQSPVDVYRLTTLNNSLTSYVFQQYGAYSIEMSGNLEDIWGRRYTGGGTYNVVIAEPLDVLPGVLPGTPFEVGNAFNAGLHIVPGVAADVTMIARIYPLDGSTPVEHVISGTANASGIFAPAGEAFTFDVAGEYVIDYEVRYTDATNRLWAGSLRSAGVIASPAGELIAHGQRGVDGVTSVPRPAWFTLSQYAPDAQTRMNTPYYTGDVLWLPDGASSQLNPTVNLQDRTGGYAAWLTANAGGFTAPDSTSLNQLVTEQALPAVLLPDTDSPYAVGFQPDAAPNRAYSYMSAITPAVSARQFVQGGTDGGLPFYFDANDPLNQQQGAGLNGSRPGDYFFLFGGAVVENEDATIRSSAIYASLAVVIDPRSDALGARVYPPYRGQAGGGTGGPLLVTSGQEVDMFFHPTAVRPGDVLRVGDTFSLAGQVAPTLASQVNVTVTAPDGSIVRQFSGIANAIGYFYDPTNDFALEAAGVYTVDIRVQHTGLTSVGVIEPPAPNGGVLGTTGGRFNIYVLPAESEPLPWSDNRTDFDIPPALAYNFRFSVPTDWQNVQIYHTLSIPSQVLEQGPLRPAGLTLSYQYSPSVLGKAFPNFENGEQGAGPAAGDTVTLTIVMTGTDASGTPQIRTRTFTIAFDRLFTFG
ncbi:MAG: hypothetical protein LCI00_26705 [Chloroflexi bacterium]|nr:hypothetical protein [Chloroflexota bacterium]MCC6893934.1 hypothetical protein [Anaerolineae bacterium]